MPSAPPAPVRFTTTTGCLSDRSIIALIDQATATIRLKAMFANDDDKLWPGEFINARVLLETRRRVLAVPSAAIQRGPQGLFT